MMVAPEFNFKWDVENTNKVFTILIMDIFSRKWFLTLYLIESLMADDIEDPASKTSIH